VTTAYVLSGGGSLGAVQVGMLQALDDMGVTPDLVVGTSVGALNGGWVAGGGDMDDLGDVWCGLHRASVVPYQPLRGLLGFAGRKPSLLDGSAIRRLLGAHLRFSRLEDAPIPLHVVAADLLTGRDVLLSTGDAVEAIAASAAIPGVFPPVVVDGRPLVDGGVVNHTPISHAVALGADQVWVLSTGFACSLREPPRGALAVAMQGLTLLVQNRLTTDVERFQAVVDLHVAPQLCPLSVSPTDFSQAAELIDRARLATHAWLSSPSQSEPLAA
jgi:NTE family protein